MNLRLLALLLLAWIAWMLFRRHWHAWQQRQQRAAPDRKLATPMVPCSHCKVHLPRDEALGTDGEWFCSPQHRQAWLSGRTG